MTKGEIQCVECPFCKALLDVSKDWVQVDAPNRGLSLFCDWKHLGRWVIEVFERGQQETERIDVV
jgi:hypothetical protein